MPKKLTETLDKLSSKKIVKFGVYLTAVILFFALILLPPMLGIIIKWNAMQQILNQPEYIGPTLSAVENSFLIAFFVSFMDVIAGIPMAWLITRGKSKWLNVLDTLCDVPFIVPTAALGYSLLLFWGDPGTSLVSPGWVLVMLLHFAFSYPVVVRVIVGALLDYKIEYEQASRTLGAPPITASRTVTFSIIKPSLIAAFILAFARSLSETGATFMVAGAFENGPVFIQKMKNAFMEGRIDQGIYEGSIVFTSFLLIGISIAIFALIHIFAPKLKLPLKRIYPTFERKLSYSKATFTRNAVANAIFFAIVLIPSLFVAIPGFEAIFTETLPNAIGGIGIWGEYWQSILTSYMVAITATILNIIIGLPMAVITARKRIGKLPSTILDLLINIPLIIPSIALGVSLAIFWKENFAFISEMLLLIFAHMAITYPYFVRSMSAAIERISLDMEEAARTLGAKPLSVFRTIILPLTKYSLISGAVIVFTRSLSETGATLAVVTNLYTAPVVIVNWVKQKVPTKVPAPAEIGLGCGFLMILSFIFLLALRLIVREKGRY